MISAQKADTTGGVITRESGVDFVTTLSRVETAVTARGLFVMRVVDHAGAAAQFGRQIPANTVVLFGNPNIGAQLMSCAPSLGLDLPQKLLIHQLGNSVRVAYNDPVHLKLRHSVDGCEALLKLVAENLDRIARDVTRAPAEAQ